MYELEVDVLEIVLVLLLRKFVKILFFLFDLLELRLHKMRSISFDELVK